MYHRDDMETLFTIDLKVVADAKDGRIENIQPGIFLERPPRRSPQPPGSPPRAITD